MSSLSQSFFGINITYIVLSMPLSILSQSGSDSGARSLNCIPSLYVCYLPRESLHTNMFTQQGTSGEIYQELSYHYHLSCSMWNFFNPSLWIYTYISVLLRCYGYYLQIYIIKFILIKGMLDAVVRDNWGKIPGGRWY